MPLEVKKRKGESSHSLVRRFSYIMRRTGIYRRVKEIEFYRRPQSKTKRKEKALRGLKIQKERERMRKLGKKLY